MQCKKKRLLRFVKLARDGPEVMSICGVFQDHLGPSVSRKASHDRAALPGYSAESYRW